MLLTMQRMDYRHIDIYTHERLLYYYVIRIYGRTWRLAESQWAIRFDSGKCGPTDAIVASSHTCRIIKKRLLPTTQSSCTFPPHWKHYEWWRHLLLLLSNLKSWKPIPRLPLASQLLLPCSVVYNGFHYTCTQPRSPTTGHPAAAL